MAIHKCHCLCCLLSPDLLFQSAPRFADHLFFPPLSGAHCCTVEAAHALPLGEPRPPSLPPCLCFFLSFCFDLSLRVSLFYPPVTTKDLRLHNAVGTQQHERTARDCEIQQRARQQRPFLLHYSTLFCNAGFVFIFCIPFCVCLRRLQYLWSPVFLYIFFCLCLSPPLELQQVATAAGVSAMLKGDASSPYLLSRMVYRVRRSYEVHELCAVFSFAVLFCCLFIYKHIINRRNHPRGRGTSRQKQE